MRWPLLLLIVPLIVGAVWVSQSGGGEAADEVWLSTGRGKGQVIYPRAIAHDRENDWYYVVDRAARIQRLDGEGNFLNAWTMEEQDLGKPVGLSVGPAGNVWVADTHYCRVAVFTPDGKRILRFGSDGDEPGQFRLVTDIAFDSSHNVYVSEYGGNDRIQVFDLAGNYLRTFGTFGEGVGEFNRPQSIAVIGEELFVADAVNHEIDVFATDGTFRRSLSAPGTAPGDLNYPYGLDVTRDGQLLVTEFGNNRVQILDPQTGQTHGTWGQAGRGEGRLAYPWAAAARTDGRAVVVDSGNNRLKVVDF
jgi:DNA-binding beta-propeller fold protein YncE